MSDDVIGTRWSSSSQEDLRVSRKNISVERRFLANIFIKNGGTLGFLAMTEEKKIILKLRILEQKYDVKQNKHESNF